MSAAAVDVGGTAGSSSSARPGGGAAAAGAATGSGRLPPRIPPPATLTVRSGAIGGGGGGSSSRGGSSSFMAAVALEAFFPLAPETMFELLTNPGGCRGCERVPRVFGYVSIDCQCHAHAPARRLVRANVRALVGWIVASGQSQPPLPFTCMPTPGVGADKSGAFRNVLEVRDRRVVLEEEEEDAAAHAAAAAATGDGGDGGGGGGGGKRILRRRVVEETQVRRRPGGRESGEVGGGSGRGGRVHVLEGALAHSDRCCLAPARTGGPERC